MKVISVTNVSRERISVLMKNGTEISLPPGEGYDDNLDIINTKALGEKIKYIADLTEVNSTSTKTKLRD